MSYYSYPSNPIPPDIRAAVIERDGSVCQICGLLTFPGGPWQQRLSLDHIVPRCHGGAHTEDNLRVACMGCNAAKGRAERRPMATVVAAAAVPQRMVSVAEAARQKNVTPRTIRQHIASGALPAYKVGPHMIRINQSDLDGLAGAA